MLDPYNAVPEKGVVPEHLLWALMFMKVYGKESMHCTMAGAVDEKTFRKWVWIFVLEISYLESEVVRCGRRCALYILILLTLLFLTNV